MATPTQPPATTKTPSQATNATKASAAPEPQRRESWANIQPQDPAGIMNLNLATLVTTPDGRGYGYTWHRATSDLFLVRGWR